MKNIARLIVLGFVGLVLVFTLLFTFAFSAHGAQAKNTISQVKTYTIAVHVPSDLDSSTCGGSWANDSFTKVYTITSDHPSVVHISFQNASFVTLDSKSPDSCYIGTKTLLGKGIHGTFTGEETATVTGGNFNPNAKCSAAASCKTTDGFVKNFYGSSATQATNTFEVEYATKENGSWRNASNDEGGNFGDIYGYPDNN